MHIKLNRTAASPPARLVAGAHPVTRRSHLVSCVTSRRVSRRAILPCPPAMATSIACLRSTLDDALEQAWGDERAGAPEDEVDPDDQADRPCRGARQIECDEHREHDREHAAEEHPAGSRQAPQLARGSKLQPPADDEPDDEQER